MSDRKAKLDALVEKAAALANAGAPTLPGKMAERIGSRSAGFRAAD